MRIAGYIRVSTTDQTKAPGMNSLDAQRMAIEGWARVHAPGSFVCVYADVESGRRADRDALTMLLEDVQRGNIDCVVVYMLDRWMRNIEEALRTLKILESHGVQFVSLSENIDTGSVAGKFARDMLLLVAQLFSEIHAQRIRDKCRAEASAGRWVTGIPPKGYILEHKRLRPDPEFAPHIRRAFELMLETRSLAVVRDYLNRHCPDKRDRWRRRAFFTTSDVRRMLSSATYAGHIVHKGEILCRNAHPAIVDESLFQRVQEVLKSEIPRVRHARNANRLFPLQGIAYCADCGNRLSPYWVRRRGKLYFYYRCNSTLRGLPCDSRNVSAEKLERAVVQAIGMAGRDPVLLASLVGFIHSQDAQQAMQAQVREHEEAIENILRAIEAGGEIPVLVQRLHFHQQALESLQQRLKAECDTISVEALRAVMERIPLVWDLADDDERRQLVLSVINRIEVHTRAGRARVWVRTVRSYGETGSPIVLSFENPHQSSGGATWHE